MHKDTEDPVRESEGDALDGAEVGERTAVEDCRGVFTGNMACIAAHPDDEVLWAGGLLQKGNWTVICCSIPRIDPVRAYKFQRCCEVLGVNHRLLPFTESDPSSPLVNLEIEDLNDFDGVLTHNSTGEYGHLHHQQVHKYVVDNFTGPVFTFGFGKGEYKFELSHEEQLRKMFALQCYNHRLPYNGTTPMKWEALLHRYMQDQDFTVETFDAHTS